MILSLSGFKSTNILRMNSRAACASLCGPAANRDTSEWIHSHASPRSINWSNSTFSYGLQSFKKEIRIIYGIKVPRADASHAFQLFNQIPQGHWVSSDPALEFRPWNNPGWEHPLANSGRFWTDTTKCSSMEMGCKFPPNTHVDLTGWRTQMCILETRVIASQKYSQSDPAGHLTGAKNGNFGQVLIPISDRSPYCNFFHRIAVVAWQTPSLESKSDGQPPT